MAPFDTRHLQQQPLRFSDTPQRGKRRGGGSSRARCLLRSEVCRKRAPGGCMTLLLGRGSTIAAERLIYLEKTNGNEYCQQRSVESVETFYRQRILQKNRAGLGSERWLCSSEHPRVCMPRGYDCEQPTSTYCVWAAALFWEIT